MKQSMICISCPLGCNMEITKEDNEYIVTGNKCPRGKKYAIEEMTAPKRVVTSTVKLCNGLYAVIPVKTEQSIPKEKIFDVIKVLADITINAPIKVGDIIVENVANTGINVIATKADSGKIRKP